MQPDRVLPAGPAPARSFARPAASASLGGTNCRSDTVPAVRRADVPASGRTAPSTGLDANGDTLIRVPGRGACTTLPPPR